MALIASMPEKCEAKFIALEEDSIEGQGSRMGAITSPTHTESSCVLGYLAR